MSHIDDLKFSSYNEGDLGDLLDKRMFDYEGYDPNFTYFRMSQKESNEKTLQSDIKKICYFYIVRGKKLTKAAQNMSAEGRSFLTKMQTKYTILDTSPTRKEDITIPRIIGISPIYCANLLKSVNARIVGEVPDGLPVSLCFPQAPSIIPTTEPELYNLWLKWAHDFNRIINQGKFDDNVDKYANIVWNVSYYNNKMRYNSLRELGIKLSKEDK